MPRVDALSVWGKGSPQFRAAGSMVIDAKDCSQRVTTKVPPGSRCYSETNVECNSRVSCHPFAAAHRVWRWADNNSIWRMILIQNLEQEVVVACNRLVTSGRESHGWLVTGAKESLVGIASKTISRSSRGKVAIPGRESRVDRLVTEGNGNFGWLINPGQESRGFRLVTGVGESHGRRLRAVGRSGARRIEITE